MGGAGKTIVLAIGEDVIHLFGYDDVWYPSTDGGGSSLDVKDADDPDFDS